MKKILILICINLLIPLLLLVVLPSILITVRHGISNISPEQPISFIKEKPITFSFISDQSNLRSLNIKFNNPGVLNNSRIVFDIKSSTSERSVVFHGNNIGHQSNIPLKFTPFNDPKNTKYQVSLTTDNTDHSNLYIIVNTSGQPIFTTYYSQTNFVYNLKQNIQNQLEVFFKRSIIHNTFYLAIIFVLNYLIIKS